jgi:hypothetical protein
MERNPCAELLVNAKCIKLKTSNINIVFAIFDRLYNEIPGNFSLDA